MRTMRVLFLNMALYICFVARMVRGLPRHSIERGYREPGVWAVSGRSLGRVCGGARRCSTNHNPQPQSRRRRSAVPSLLSVPCQLLVYAGRTGVARASGGCRHC